MVPEVPITRSNPALATASRYSPASVVIRFVILRASRGDTGSLFIIDTEARTIRKINVVTDDNVVEWRPPDGRQLMVTARVSRGARFALVSPVKIGDRAYTGTGSVITKDVPDGALGVARGRQVNLEGWADKNRAKKQKSKEPK